MGRDNDKEEEELSSEVDDEYDDEKDNSDIEDTDGDPNKKYKCTHPGCNARFLRPSRLTWHLRKHNDERPYKCDQEGCDRAYTNSSHLKRHLNTTHKSVTKSYECQECGAEVGSLFSLKRHHKKIHDPQRLTCAQCGAKFRKRHCYNEHLSMHAGVAMYTCDICNQNFTQLRLYKKHQRVHEPQKTYPCTSPGCKEIFNKWSKLNKHLGIHHEYDHSCDKCEKKFKRKKLLATHQAAHERAGVVKSCPYENCPRFYYYKKNLDEHIYIVHLGRRFSCDACEKTFKFKSNLVKHIKVVHEGIKITATKRKKPRRRRKDAGDRKRSMATKLAGIKLPDDLERRVLQRQPRIVLKRFDEKSDDSSEQIAKEKSSSLTVKMNREILKAVRKLVKKTSDKLEEEVNEISCCSSDEREIEKTTIPETFDSFDENNDRISEESVDIKNNEQLIDAEEFVNEIGINSEKNNDEVTSLLPIETPMFVDDDIDTLENEEALLASLLDVSENESPMKVVEKYLETSEKNDESTTIDDLGTDTPLMNALRGEKPIVLAQYGEELLLTSDQNYQKISQWMTTDSVEVTVPLIFIDTER